MQLNRQDVLDGAIAILDEYGLADLTMRRLATSLHVQPGALYWHFPNKQTLLGAIADHILSGADAPSTEESWDAQIAQIAHRLRDALLSRRDGAELVAATYASRLTTNHIRERIAAVCIRAGLPRRDAELTADTLLYYILGQTVDEQARLQMDSAGALTPDASPLFESPDPTSRFDFGLKLFLDGVRHTAVNRMRR
ncbi:TetR family transcriptional regulator [Rhodococcus sp. 06-470-2]|uniref:TetR/AcrR family transcriptional regulator C-terminal domain-containing protein n=1 Tax=unclassified Rhodococcus (in: high G+C Gram-positive bacteria) TaxID=192944 RepID=UPI000B9A713D|nr:MULTISPECIES: TetR/AcrR family transcriptional regulator C-terminal domain-containing protein [unclassified Rhodococcus (in: high G+C Gram-positive bacteria)]OZC64361.1 TetR family transcriptional regulator [Rhodococcus sp. 06-470-2]OZE56900.1 TetR family transcriptional regulator [Rhodococcus sp. 05-2221-1B]